MFGKIANIKEKVTQPVLFPKVQQNMCEILDTFELFSNTELVQIIAEEIKTYTEY
jgi:hypothetical protein